MKSRQQKIEAEMCAKSVYQSIRAEKLFIRQLEKELSALLASGLLVHARYTIDTIERARQDRDRLIRERRIWW